MIIAIVRSIIMSAHSLFLLLWIGQMVCTVSWNEFEPILNFDPSRNQFEPAFSWFIFSGFEPRKPSIWALFVLAKLKNYCRIEPTSSDLNPVGDLPTTRRSPEFQFFTVNGTHSVAFFFFLSLFLLFIPFLLILLVNVLLIVLRSWRNAVSTVLLVNVLLIVLRRS